MQAASGALLLWLDYRDPEREPFYAWHARDHIPARLSVPGFLRARRYAAVRGAPEYLVWYELESPSALEHPSYIEQSNAAPTTRDLAIGRHFDNVTRWVCQVQQSLEGGCGGLALTLRYRVPAAAAAAHAAALTRDVLPELARSAGVCACHLLRALPPPHAPAVEATHWALLVESWGDEAQLGQTLDGLEARPLPHALPESIAMMHRLQLLR